MQERGHWIVAAGIVLLTLAAYLKVAEFDYVNYDDHRYVSENPRIADGLTTDNVLWAFTTFEFANWHPLTWLSYMLDTALFGPNKPGTAHLTNIVLHALNAAMLFLLLRRLTASLWRSALVAALFAIHPLHVESVAWISERKDVLSTLFGFAAIWSYVSYAKQRRPIDLAFVTLFHALSLMAKPTLVTLPVLLLLLDHWPLQRWRDLSNIRTCVTLILEKWPLILLSAASCIVTIIAQHAGGALRDFTHVPPAGRIANAVASYVIYLWQTVRPINLIMFYPYPESRPIWIVALCAGLLIAISTIVVILCRKRPYLVTGWLWYIVALLPVIGLVQVGAQSHADRYTYIPLIGVYIMLAWSLPDGPRPVRFATIAAMFVALGILVTLQQQQVEYWRNDRTLAEHALAVTKDNEIAHLLMGNVKLDEGDFAAAAEHFEESTRLQPNWADAHNNLGNAAAYLGQPQRSLNAYRRALEIQPGMADARYNLGVLLHAMNNLSDAANELKKAIESDPRHQRAMVQLGAVLNDMNRLDEAANWLETAAALQPNDPFALIHLADVQAKLDRIEEARMNFNRAAQLAEASGLDELRKQALDRRRGIESR